MTSQRLGEFKSSGIINVNNNPSIGGLSIKYGDFGQADPELTKNLPSSVNLGLTSPGFLDNASDCTGIDFINTNPDYEKITFSQCLNKFQDQYFIPEQGFASLLKNLPYTFNSMNIENQKYYINELQKFIDTVNTSNKNKQNKKENFADTDTDTNKNSSSEQELQSYPECKGVPNIEVNYILIIIIFILTIVMLYKFLIKN